MASLDVIASSREVQQLSNSNSYSEIDDETTTSDSGGSQFTMSETAAMNSFDQDPLRLGIDSIEIATTPRRRRPTATLPQDDELTSDQLGPRDFEPYQPSPRTAHHDHDRETSTSKYRALLTPIHRTISGGPVTGSSPLSVELSSSSPSNNNDNQSPRKYGKNGRRRLCKDAFSRPRDTTDKSICKSGASSMTSRMPPSSPPETSGGPEVQQGINEASSSLTPIVHPVMKNDDQYVYRLRKDDEGNDILVPVYMDDKKVSYNQFPYANSMSHIPRFPFREFSAPFLANNCPSPEGTPALSDGSSIQNSPAVLPAEWATPTMMGLGELQSEDVSSGTDHTTTEDNDENSGTSANSSQSAFASSPIITPEIRAIVHPEIEKQKKQSRKLAFKEPITEQKVSEDLLHDPEKLYKQHPQSSHHPFLVKRTTTADLCPKPLARALLVCGICFPPVWLLIAAGTFDQSLGHIDRNTKLAAMVLSSITMTAGVIGICVGIGVGETAGR